MVCIMWASWLSLTQLYPSLTGEERLVCHFHAAGGGPLPCTYHHHCMALMDSEGLK